jgi:hypothetical protein
MRSAKVSACGTLVVLALALVPARAGTAADERLATSFFARGLSPASSWAEILGQPQIDVDWPFLPFGKHYVALPETCLADREIVSAAYGRTTEDEGPMPQRYMVNVYRVIRTVPNLHRVFLFQKEWDIAPCRPGMTAGVAGAVAPR